MVCFALPDGHQMKHVLQFLDRTSISFKGYNSDSLSRRPVMEICSDAAKKAINDPSIISAKVIRPQDMPMQVATNNFDIAITGIDWYKDHKFQFPFSPVRLLMPLGFGKVRIVAAIHNTLPINTIDQLKDFLNTSAPYGFFRIASEYAYIADDYAKQHNLYKYRIIMTYGATESLIPEDAEMIIENTETGNTLRKNNLRIIDDLFPSEGCLIVNDNSYKDARKKGIIDSLEAIFRGGLS